MTHDTLPFGSMSSVVTLVCLHNTRVCSPHLSHTHTVTACHHVLGGPRALGGRAFVPYLAQRRLPVIAAKILSVSKSFVQFHDIKLCVIDVGCARKGTSDFTAEVGGSCRSQSFLKL